MLFVCYPKCSTCKKAQAWLDAQGIPYELRDIKLQNPTEDELRQWSSQSGLQYKALSLKEKLPDMSEDEQFSLLASDGMIVKRPLLIGDDFVLVGFQEAQWTETLPK